MSVKSLWRTRPDLASGIERDEQRGRHPAYQGAALSMLLAGLGSLPQTGYGGGLEAAPREVRQ